MADGPEISDARAARLRRIVRDGEEIVRRITRLRADLEIEVPDWYRDWDRGSDRASDLLDVIRKRFDEASFHAEARAKSAVKVLEEVGLPVRFTRAQPIANEAASPTEESLLVKIFGIPEESADSAESNDFVVIGRL